MTGGDGSAGPRDGMMQSRPRPRRSRPRAPIVDALVLDRYLDSLLADTPRVHDAVEAPDVDPATRRAAGRLRLELARVHPSFRFEERLAARLADAANRMKLPAAAGAEGVVVTIPLSAEAPGDVAAGAAASGAAAPTAAGQAILAGPASPATSGGLFAGLPDASAVIAGLPRPLVIGGALTSAALSIAGAYVAWRAWPALRPAGPMARAVRAARQARAIPLPGAGVDATGIVARARQPVRFDVIGAAGTLVARTRARLD